MSFLLEVSVNAEGDKQAYLGKADDEGNYIDGCYRIAGPKAWGGSRNIARLDITEDDLVEFIKSYAPEVIMRLTPNAKYPNR